MTRKIDIRHFGPREEGRYAPHISMVLNEPTSVEFSAHYREEKMTSAPDHIMLTILLKHQKDKNLAEINSKLDASGYWAKFPPEGTTVVSWYVMMGIGQVVTLSVPASKLRDVNLAIEQCAWGAFDTEFHPTYDFKPIWEKLRAEKLAAKVS